MDVNLPLNYFLVDDGEINGGIFLASAYQHLIEWQNSIYNIVIIFKYDIIIFIFRKGITN